MYGKSNRGLDHETSLLINKNHKVFSQKRQKPGLTDGFTFNVINSQPE